MYVELWYLVFLVLSVIGLSLGYVFPPDLKRENVAFKIVNKQLRAVNDELRAVNNELRRSCKDLRVALIKELDKNGK